METSTPSVRSRRESCEISPRLHARRRVSGREAVGTARILCQGTLLASPGPHRRDRRLQSATMAGGGIGACEIWLQLREHPLTTGLGSIVGVVVQILVRQRELGQRAPRLAVLHQERACGVGQVVLVADL